MAGVQRGGSPGREGEVECERKARREHEARNVTRARRESSIVWDLRDPNDRASRSDSTFPLPPLCKPATQASVAGARREHE